MKKLVSRFMAVLMAMTMILSMSMTVFAAEAPKGTLTVNNTVAGKTLDLYQIFTATKNGDNVAYTRLKFVILQEEVSSPQIWPPIILPT